MISCIDNQPTGPSVPHRTDLQAEFFTPAREPEIKQRWGPPRDACMIGSPLCVEAALFEDHLRNKA